MTDSKIDATIDATKMDASLAKQYQRKTDKQHILDNPDTYIGSVENVDAEMWVYDDSKGMIVLKHIEYIPGLYKLFDEGIVNCRDHVLRMIHSSNVEKKFVTYISTEIADDGTITMSNDGNGIDIAKHPEHDLWIPEMIFGHLRTSTNYDKTEKKIVGGKNGFGFKLVLIWSTYGRIETVDHIRGLKYVQEFRNNLDVLGAPVITKCSSAKPYTKVSFKPDYQRLGIGGLTPDMIALLKKRVYDISAVTDHSVKKVKITYNGDVAPCKNFQQYVDLYIGSKSAAKQQVADDASVSSAAGSDGSAAKRVYEQSDERWEYAVALSPTHEFIQVSFVNGICTFKGGKHVEYITGQIVRKLCDYIEKKKKIKVNGNAIKEQLILFLRCDIENPSFDSQTKDYMNTPSAKFGSSCSVSDAFIEKVAKMGVMDLACSLTEAKENRLAKKSTDGSKTKTVRGIANFMDANNSGTAASKDCILILCEGLSAMSGIVSGLSSEDRNSIGIYPLKGKLLNVRGEQLKKIAENKEITDIKKILGLESGREYKTMADVQQYLRYGKIMFMCDQDSVTSDTPLFLKNRNGEVEIKTIDTISNKWDTLPNEKEESNTDYEIWTESGWTKIKRVIRHLVNKRIFRVLTHTGVVDVTEDHSLITENNEEISPKTIQVDDKLLHSFPSFLENKHTMADISKMTNTEIKKISRNLKISYYCTKSREQLLSEIEMCMNKPNIEIPIKNYGITPEEAYVMGLFWADGTCKIYKWQCTRKPVDRPNEYVFNRTAYAWSICNTNLDYLNKAKAYIEKIYEYEFKIIKCDTTNLEYCNSDVYKLIINGGKSTQPIIDKYRALFYDEYSKKKIPVEILNSAKNIREEFFEGYYDGDGCKSSLRKNGSRYFDIDGKIGAHGMFLLCRSIGFSVSININPKKPKVYTLTITKGYQQDNPNRVKKIIDLGITEQYVYDLETENHHFQAGVGQMIVHNTDGSHIKGLCINLFHSEWSSLIKIPGFLSFMNTPILRARKGTQTKLFYNDGEYQTWKQLNDGNINGWTIKYFKGLGTSTSAEFKMYFEDKKFVDFIYSGPSSDDSIDKIFNKKRADDRKVWLENYDKAAYLDTSHKSVKYEDFMNRELIHFSTYDCARSIPNMVDGLKISLRKILYSAFKRKLTSEIKVAQFSGYVSEHSAYHHGEASLNGAIVNMAQNFVGSNNINILEPNGQFGTRLQGGDDSASERYIFTQLNPLTRALFPDMDDAVLSYLDDDGTVVEPEYYVPIIPFALVNGISGIGTGFSCSIPAYNPATIVGYLKNKLRGLGNDSVQFVPYYEGFKGSIRKIEDHKYLIKGCYEKVGEDKIRITELPVGTWTMPYITVLEGMMDGGVDKAGKKVAPTLKDMVSMSTEVAVDIVVTFPKGKLAELEGIVDAATGVNGLEKMMKLTTTVSTTNMHMFDANIRLHKYGSVEEIIDDFYGVRLSMYGKRKAQQVKDMEQKLVRLSNRARYIKETLDGVVDLRRKNAPQVEELMLSRKFDKIEDSFKYLIKMPMDSVTQENVEQIMKEREVCEKDLATLKATTLEQIWLSELDVLDREYATYKIRREKIQAGSVASTAKKTVIKKISKK